MSTVAPDTNIRLLMPLDRQRSFIQRPVLRQGRLAAAGLVAAIWLISAVATAAEPAEDFLKRLRAAGYFEIAISYLDRLDRYPGIDPELLTAVELEKAQTHIDAALAARKPAERDERFAEAEAALQRFLESPGHPRASEARLRLGTIQLTRARQLTLGEADEEKRARARESYLAAAETFDTIIENLRGKLVEMRGQRIDPSSEPEKVALRDRYRNDFLNAQLNSGNARYLAAQTYDEPAADGEQLLQTALERFNQLHEDYGNKYVPGVIALLYRGKVLQALGRPAEAIDSYLRMLEQPDADPLRESKFEAASGLIELWLAEDPPKYQSAVERGQGIVQSLRPDEKDLPSVQRLRVNLAEAYLAMAADKDEQNPAEIRRATANARRLLNTAKRVPGEHREETERLLAELGIESVEPELPTAKDPKDLAEAVESARQMVESASTLQRTIEMLRQQPDKSDDVVKQIEEMEAELARQQRIGTMILRRGLAMVSPDDDRETASRARQLLTYLLYQQQRYREAAVVGGFIARTEPGTESGLQNGLLALNALQLLISQSGNESGAALVPHLERLGTYLADTWPGSSEASAARGVMVQLALSKDRWEEAERLVEEMPAGPEKARLQRLVGQLTWNRSLQARRDGDASRADALLREAITDLQAGLEGIPGKLIAPEAMRAAVILAKAHLRDNNSQGALAALDHPKYGPTRLVEELDPPSESFPVDLYSTELQAVVGQMTAPDSDAGALLDRAERAMGKLRESVRGEDAQRKLLGVLVKLAQDIRDQIDVASPTQQQKLIDAFRLFVDRIAESSRDPATLQWVGNTLLQMGESLVQPTDVKAQGRAAELIGSAAKAFKELSEAAEEPSLTVRYQLARAQRLLGEYKPAIDELEAILREKPNMLDAQIEAATAYEKWAKEVPPKYQAKAYEAALLGARPGSDGKNTIWGWGKISQLTSRNPKFRETFFEARYHLALCRFLMGRAMGDERVIEKAIGDITSVAALYPDLGGPDQKRDFDLLLRQIQKEAGQPATGLP